MAEGSGLFMGHTVDVTSGLRAGQVFKDGSQIEDDPARKPIGRLTAAPGSPNFADGNYQIPKVFELGFKPPPNCDPIFSRDQVRVQRQAVRNLDSHIFIESFERGLKTLGGS